MIDVTKKGHVLFYGQSLSIGARSTELTTSQPYSNLMFSDGVKGTQTPLIPLIESGDESPVSGTVNYLSELYSSDNPVFLGSTAGQSGRNIDQLSKGSVFYGGKLLPQVRNGSDETDYFAAICWVQGEADSLLGHAAGEYQAKLESLAGDIRGDVLDSYPSGEEPPFITYQTSSRSLVTEHVVLDQLNFASNANATLSTPTYFLEYENGIHLSGAGYRLLGNYFAKAIHDLSEGRTPYIRPLNAIASDKVLIVRFQVPHLPLVIDTAKWVTTDHGFRVVDAAGNVPITTVDATNDSVIITLGRDVQPPAVVRYALDYEARALGQSEQAAGNLRDSDPRQSTTSVTPLNNWTPHFQLPIITENTMTINSVQDYEMLDHFDIDPAAATSNGKNQYKPKNLLEITPYSTARANTVAEVSAGAGSSVDFESTGFLTTNKAVEPTATGYRNTDGSMGSAKIYSGMFSNDGSDDGLAINLDENNGIARVNNKIGDTTPVTLGSGRYNGQLITIIGNSVDPVVLAGSYRGKDLRNSDNRTYRDVNTSAFIAVRRWEVLELMWFTNRWYVVTWDKNLHESAGHKELINGTEVWGFTTIDNVNTFNHIDTGLVFDANLTSGNTHVTITDYFLNGRGDGETLLASEVRDVTTDFVWSPAAGSTTTHFSVAACPSGASDSDAPIAITWRLLTSARVVL